MKENIQLFFKKYLEFILVGLAIFFIFAKSEYPRYGERISLLFFGTLAFYYLASGVLVFLDRHRIMRSMRLIYLVGLWGVSTTVIGTMARIHLIQMNEELLYTAVAAMLAALGFAFLAYRQVEGDDNKQAWRWQLQPIIIRSALAILVSLGIVLSTPFTVYNTFGTYRKDPSYSKDAVYVYEHPDDTTALRLLEERTQRIREGKE